jgi:hypothetical protein
MTAMALAMTAALLAAPLKGPGPWILTCEVGGHEDGAPARVFRLGPQLFQEWSARDKTFGYNLCASFPCVARRDRLEGEISSTTLVLTITVDPATGTASWRTQGAANMKRSSGPCSIRPDAPDGKKAAP